MVAGLTKTSLRGRPRCAVSGRRVRVPARKGQARKPALPTTVCRQRPARQGPGAQGGKRANLRGRPRCAVSGRRVRVLARCPRGDRRRAACLCDVAGALY